MGSSGRDDWNRHWKDYGQVAGQNPAQNYRVQLTLSLLGIQGSGEGDAGFTHEYVSGVGFPFFNLYRCLVILRGKRLIDDIRPTGEASLAARLAMAGLQMVVRPGLNSSRWGWQMVAVARPNGSSS